MSTINPKAASAKRDAHNLLLEARAERLLGAHDLADYLEYLAERKQTQAIAAAA